ncbi:CG11714 [Drosophila busckii]|uniref:CG11714 n=1 Tax=Drosophila busckii TaxID=30019 RepID=A0A0M4EZF8_DROBS|nr:uncharacterized protein LOC108600861 [Drosophila busckii]ALC43770.1 CG11714 [Drosophila busckii]
MQKSDGNWQDLKPRERMEYLLRTGHLSDCSFVVFADDGEKIHLKCHKFVLMSASPVFERMFEGDFEEGKTPENIVLDDVSGTDFQKFIQYLYWHDNKNLDTYDLQTLQTLIYLSKKFMVNAMCAACINSIKRRLDHGMDADVTIDLFEYAHQIEDNELINAILHQFKFCYQKYVNSPAVYDLSSEIFLKFITEFKSYVDNKKRFDLIDQYCKIHGLSINSSQTTTAEKKTASSNEQKDMDRYRMKRWALSTNINTASSEPSNETETVKDENQNKIDESKDLTDKPADNNAPMPNDDLEQQKRMEYITKLLQTIKFTDMTSYDFCSGPGSSDLLSLEEKYQLLSSICIAVRKVNLFGYDKK